jgi:hypothetical protein
MIRSSQPMITPPRPQWRPSNVESPSLIARAASSYTNSTRAFVVYGFGTVVFSDTNKERLDIEYDNTLKMAITMQPDFSVLEMSDHNYLIRFSGPVSGVVLKNFYESNKIIINDGVAAGGLSPGEKILPGDSRSMSDIYYSVGLYARVKLYCDADDPQIFFRFVPVK